MLTVEQFKKLFPLAKNPASWVESINKILPKYNITPGPRLWMFLAQCGHESAGFSVLQENLNYSKEGLLKVFPKYFTPELAEKCARKPQMIANIVYANRMGNGDTASNEGWFYRGQGCLQITSKDNMRKFSMDCYGDDRILKNPSLLTEPDAAIESACWFWKSRNLNKFCDTEDIIKVTKLINGGIHGLDCRLARYKTAKSVIPLNK